MAGLRQSYNQCYTKPGPDAWQTGSAPQFKESSGKPHDQAQLGASADAVRQRNADTKQGAGLQSAGRESARQHVIAGADCVGLPILRSSIPSPFSKARRYGLPALVAAPQFEDLQAGVLTPQDKRKPARLRR